MPKEIRLVNKTDKRNFRNLLNAKPNNYLIVDYRGCGNNGSLKLDRLYIKAKLNEAIQLILA